MGIFRPITNTLSILSLLILSSPLSPSPIQIVEEQISVRVNEPIPWPQLEIQSTPSDAWVYIEGNHSGYTPLLLKDLSPSLYVVQIQKSGYRPLSFLVTLKTGIRTRVQLELMPLYGTLSLEDLPPESQVYVAGTLVSGRNILLPVGTYRVVVRRFGYEDIVTQVHIHEGQLTKIPLSWKQVSFSVSRVTVIPQRINPEKRVVPARISFVISAPAEITLLIQDGLERTVWEKRIAEPIAPIQQVEWDGRDQRGNPLPDGIYRLILQFKSTDASTELIREIILDRKVRNTLTTTYSGNSGLLFTPIVPILNPGSFRISSWILGQVGNSSQEASPALVHAGISFPLDEGWELSSTLSSFMDATDSPPDGMAGLGVQYRWKETETFVLGITGRGAYMNRPREYGFSQLGGLSLGAIVEFRYGVMGFLLSPELTLSPYERQNPGDLFNLYGSLRGGWYLDLGEVRIGISSILTAHLPAFDPLPSYHTGIEVHWKRATLPFVFSLGTILIRSAEGSLIVYTGGGMGAMY
ncbi:MAG: PEGA domain-containing protein [Spirochaetes bacterium]|nr:PEGA domain-containing protein [Spirochaetota bacterium]